MFQGVDSASSELFAVWQFFCYTAALSAGILSFFLAVHMYQGI
jgi:hypothetical protein